MQTPQKASIFLPQEFLLVIAVAVAVAVILAVAVVASLLLVCPFRAHYVETNVPYRPFVKYNYAKQNIFFVAIALSQQFSSSTGIYKINWKSKFRLSEDLENYFLSKKCCLNFPSVIVF